MSVRLTPLKRTRMERGVLQVELSQLTGVERSRLSRLENGWESPKPDELARIAAALNVPPDRLLEVRAA